MLNVCIEILVVDTVFKYFLQPHSPKWLITLNKVYLMIRFSSRKYEANFNKVFFTILISNSHITSRSNTITAIIFIILISHSMTITTTSNKMIKNRNLYIHLYANSNSRNCF